MSKIKITIPKPDWNSNLTTTILDLEQLRKKKLYGEIPPHIFFQLKETFQLLETLSSARIEGNNTTLSERVEEVISRNKKHVEESSQEITNLENAISFIETNTNQDTILNRAYISELHKILSKNLLPPSKGGEGSDFPGELRKKNVRINKSKHIPPDYTVVPDYFIEFIAFINQSHKEQNQLLMIAIAHHRFAYIHAFDNGNGRLGRLLTYALLIKSDFKVKEERIINPSVVFYSDRDKYYQMLGIADSLSSQDLLAWSEYFLGGLKNELHKIDGLLNKTFVKEKILIPAINFALDRENITVQEHRILILLTNKKNIQMGSQDLSEIGIHDSVKKSRIMKKLRDRNFIYSIKENGRIYTVNFTNNILLRGIIRSLKKEGFVSEFLNSNG